MDPVLAGSMAYAAGVRVGLDKWLPVLVWVTGLAFFGVFIVFIRKKELPKEVWIGVCMGCMFCAGAWRSGMEETAAARMTSVLSKRDTFTGRIVPGTAKKSRQGSMTFLMEEKRGRIRVFVRKAGSFQPEYGVVQATGPLQPIDGFYNPGVQMPEVGAAIRGEGGRLQVNGRDCRILSQDLTWTDRIYKLGKALRQQLRHSMAPEDSALLEGMMLGGSQQISSETLRMFQRCGLSHLLSVSGSHVALLMGILAGGTRLFHIPRKAAIPLIMVLLLGYGVLCGLRASVCRAVLLGMGVLLGRAGRRRARGTAFLGLAAILLLTWKPWWCRDPGFQLSFTAALGLMTLRRPVAEKLGVFLPRPLAQGLAVPISAQLLSLPFLVEHFHSLSPVSLWANLLLVPLLSLCLTGSAVGAALGCMGLIVPARPILAGVSQLLGAALWMGNSLAKLPGTQLVTGQVSWWLWPLYILLVLSVLEIGWFQPFRSRLRAGTIAAASLGLVTVLALPRFQSQPFTVYFLDVGQGDCAVAVTPEREIIVVDTGGLPGQYDTGERILVPFLRWLGADKVDILILSHGHLDHAGGAAGLSHWFPISALALPAPDLTGTDGFPTKTVAKLISLEQFRQNRKIVYKMQTNQKICKKKSIIQIVEAPTEYKEGGENENSGIVRLVSGPYSVLFTGDATGGEELRAAARAVRSDVLKVSHHGSRSSSCPEFLAGVSPRLGVISAGRGNRFGHPHREVLERLDGLGIPVARTDTGGAIKVVFDGRGPVWYSYRWQQDFF